MANEFAKYIKTTEDLSSFPFELVAEDYLN